MVSYKASKPEACRHRRTTFSIHINRSPYCCNRLKFDEKELSEFSKWPESADLRASGLDQESAQLPRNVPICHLQRADADFRRSLESALAVANDR